MVRVVVFVLTLVREQPAAESGERCGWKSRDNRSMVLLQQQEFAVMIFAGDDERHHDQRGQAQLVVAEEDDGR
jgi:hypothetical protein